MNNENNSNSISSGINSTQRYIFITEGARWRCVRCGRCCTEDFERQWLEHIGIVIDDQFSNGRCKNLSFIDGKHYCENYQSRPNACRAFPFTLRKGEDGDYRLVIHSKCLGYGRGKKINIEERIKQCIRHSNREFHKRLRFDFTWFNTNKSVILVK